jgi:hypothetical protein
MFRYSLYVWSVVLAGSSDSISNAALYVRYLGSKGSGSDSAWLTKSWIKRLLSAGEGALEMVNLLTRSEPS